MDGHTTHGCSELRLKIDEVSRQFRHEFSAAAVVPAAQHYIRKTRDNFRGDALGFEVLEGEHDRDGALEFV